MAVSSAALIGLACVLSGGQHPEISDSLKSMTTEEQAVVNQIIQSELCNSPEFQKLIVPKNQPGRLPEDLRVLSCVQTTDTE